VILGIFLTKLLPLRTPQGGKTAVLVSTTLRRRQHRHRPTHTLLEEAGSHREAFSRLTVVYLPQLLPLRKGEWGGLPSRPALVLLMAPTLTPQDR